MHMKLNNKFFKTSLIKSDFKIINIFIKLNIIKNVKQIYNYNNKSKNKNYLIYLNNNSSFKNFLNLHKPSSPVKINLKNIIKLNKKSTRLFLISSNKGLINNIEAEKLKVGGFLILNILQ